MRYPMYLTTSEAALPLSLSIYELRKDIRDERIAYSRVGRRIIFHTHELKEHIHKDRRCALDRHLRIDLIDAICQGFVRVPDGIPPDRTPPSVRELLPTYMHRDRTLYTQAQKGV